MFDYIRGLVTYLSSGWIAVETGGIGYRIICANPFSYQSLINRETTVYLYQYVREDAMVLYGFKTREARDFFVRLLSVSGIGPKNALAILAVGEPGRIIRAIEGEDAGYLTRFPGIGKKTAGQIILDLKGKMKNFTIQPAADLEERQGKSHASVLTEALEALKTLGYSEREIKRVVPALKKQDLTAESYVKEALRLLTMK
ncbi:Holliday junction branch migration protein RuvA [Sporolactobacillus sp. THM7-7]|nr:Holliday junction branch migration protein RuvA [Sporolactobacillus sp. THM7-7]